jgi:ATP-dependent exoDNAse (exonuclease V) beta subunit
MKRAAAHGHNPPRSARPELVRILASAGSGKTFALSSAYLRIAARGEQLQSILASTFTRLAAGEIRDRVLLRLAEAIERDDKRLELARSIERPDISAGELLMLLRTLAEHMPRLQIRTLDSFFASIVRAFEFELGIPPGSVVVDEAEEPRLRAEAVRLMLDETDSQTLVDLLRAITQGQANRGVSREIDSVVSALHGLFMQARPEAWECVPVVGRRLQDAPLAEAINAFCDFDIGDQMRLINAHAAACDRVRNHQWEEFIEAGIASAIVDKGGLYYGKPIAPEIIAAYQPLIEHALAHVTSLWRAQTIATRDLLALYDVRYDAVRKARRSLTFSDFTRALALAAERVELQEVFFRLDGSLRHVLLDEFQDTSVAQWRALQPLVSELVADETEDRTLLAVGDVKQSIYGWREAAPELLERLPGLLTESGAAAPLRDEQLTRSWRSSPVIIDFVNDVFSSMSSNGALADCPDAAAWWDRTFATHTTARLDLPGHVSVRAVRRATEDENGETTETKDGIRCEAAAALVAELYARDPALSIAVLARRNKLVGELLYRLGPGGHDIPVSGRGGRALSDTAPVNAILDLLQLADHPDHTAGAFHVASSPLGPVVGLTEPGDARQRERVASAVRRRVMREGLAAAIGAWVDRITAECDAWQQARLAQLVDLAAKYDRRRTLRCDDFMDSVEATLVPSPRASVVQVMTTHQAKGLEFDAVVLVELDAPLIGRAPKVMFSRSGPVGDIVRICRTSNKSTRALAPELEALYAEWEMRAVRGSLCTLYVAATRAKHALYVLIDPVAATAKTLPRTSAGIVRAAVLDDPLDARADATLHERGDAQWMDHIPPRTSAAGAERVSPAPPDTGGGERGAAAAVRLGPADPNALRGWQAPSPSEHEEDAARLLSVPNFEARESGTALHAFFEQIEYIDDFTLDAPARARLLAVAGAKLPRRPAEWFEARLAEFERAISSPEVCAALARGSRAADQTRVLREHPFARLRDQGSVQSGTIDRVDVTLDAAGRPVAARIIDFKTDRIEAAEVAAQAEHHRPQLEAYRDVAAELLQLDAGNVRMTLVFVKAGEVVDL